ncbi:hypothetical protein D5018_08835 [Parashewanella curva]|uniref:Uncharacterized protein n=1 Tax=Parashewanella curva TaxID=2338552 RepID=A0A3L8Q143_9GAMM|nr:hypothetical protein [Parashewanella curva]RLV60112.1 hypothetical protein D5018_08835 [Parashewanella curva]
MISSDFTNVATPPIPEPPKTFKIGNTTFEYPDDKTIAECEQLGQEIISKFPPSQYCYIGFGYHPHILFAWLEAKNISSDTAQIPLSEFRLCPHDGYGLYPIKAPILPTSQQCEILYQHFDTYLEDLIKTAKHWLIIDVAETGNNLCSAGFALSHYLASHNVEKKIELLAIAENDQIPSTYFNLGMNLAMVQPNTGVQNYVTGLELFIILGGGTDIAPFQKFNWQDLREMSESPKKVEPSPQYQKLVEYLSSWKKHPQLDVAWGITLTTQSTS